MEIATDSDLIVGAEGNTGLESSAPTTKKQPTERKFYCFTQFDFLATEATIKQWLIDNCVKCFVGYEICPTTNRPHLQGFFELKKKQRITAIQNKPIKWSKLIPCDGNYQSNLNYCSKDGNLWFQHPKPRAPLKIITELRPFQLEIENILLQEPDDRTIYWIYDEEGKKGKSSFCRYLIHKYDALYLTEGKKTDLINIVYNYVLNKDLNIVLVDVPRSNKNISYKTLEEIKNGIICNTKYETGTHLINPPHIIVFANFYPDREQFTDDRWCIYTISNSMELIPIDELNNT